MDWLVWQGFNQTGAALGRCYVLNWTVLPLKILGRHGKQHRVTVKNKAPKDLYLLSKEILTRLCVK